MILFTNVFVCDFALWSICPMLFGVLFLAIDPSCVFWCVFDRGRCVLCFLVRPVIFASVLCCLKGVSIVNADMFVELTSGRLR